VDNARIAKRYGIVEYLSKNLLHHRLSLFAAGHKRYLRRPNIGRFTPVQLRNGGLEDSTAGWEFNIYGARATVGALGEIQHGGMASLSIASAEPSDAAAAGQEVQLKPRQ
jgi:hypothetical protein